MNQTLSAHNKESKRYAIGVDSDQYKLFKDTDPEKASFIVTSMKKNAGLSLYKAIKLHMEGKLPYGKAEAPGLKEDGIAVADNENYEKLVPAKFRDRIKEIEKRFRETIMYTLEPFYYHYT